MRSSALNLNFMISRAKRIADQYGAWVAAGDLNRREKLQILLNKEHLNKIRRRAKSIIKHRYNE